MLIVAIEKILVDFMDANGFQSEKRGEDWILHIGEGAVSLTELAFAIEQWIRTKM